MSLLEVNSSFEITCSTMFSEPSGLSLHRGFHGNEQIIYLNIKEGNITKITSSENFEGRINVVHDQQIQSGYGLRLQLSLLKVEDTDWYYCRWLQIKATGTVEDHNGGVIVIVRGEKKQFIDGVLFILLNNI